MADFDRVAHVYDATRSLRPEVMEKVVEGIVQFMDGSTLIDFGVGTGRFAAPLARSGIQVTGLDIAPTMIRQAKEKGVGDLVLSSAESTPFRSASFDYAMVVHFMHLLRDWRAAVAEIARVTRRGLVTVLEDPAGFHPRDLYLDLRESMGFGMSGLKHGERDMVEMVAPELRKELAAYREELDPAALMDEYGAKQHSITWDVPDEANKRIVLEMRKRLGPKRTQDRSVSLAVWGHDQLARFQESA